MTAYRVLSPYVTILVKDPNTGANMLLGFYAGAPVPPNAVEEDVARLVRKGMIVEAGTVAAEVLAVPAGTPIPGEPPNVPVPEVPPTGLTVEERLAKAEVDTPGSNGRPAVRAPKDDWVAYAVSQRAEGVSEEDARAEAEGKKKEDLIAEYYSKPADESTE